MASYFASPLTNSQQAPTLRASNYRRPRKRRRGEDAPESNDGPEAEFSSRQMIGPENLYSAADTAQYTTAGWKSGDELPPAPFPHAPPRSSKAKVDVERELANLNPPVFVPPCCPSGSRLGKPGNMNVRQQHLGVMVAILHRCLAEGDFDRASRAWGMILRSQVGGSAVDLRVNGRWGIGAEILLRRHSQSHQNFANDTSASYLEGFQAARSYYDHLILQYPTLKNHPYSLNSSVFYPAMFSIWIYEVCEIGRLSRLKRSNSPTNLVDSTSTMPDWESQDPSSSFSSDSQMDPDDSDPHETYAQELEGAKKIAEELDKLLVSPPFDKNPDLLQLRGMVSLWIGDLLATGFKDHRNKSPLRHEDMSEDITSLSESIGKRYHIREAVKAFVRAKQNGARLWEGITHLVGDEDASDSSVI